MLWKFILVFTTNLILTSSITKQASDINFIPEKFIIVDVSSFNNVSLESVSNTNCMKHSSIVHVCPSFQDALESLENNTIINFTTNAVLLQSIVYLNKLNNIAIVGQNKTTVECNNSGALNYSSCNNVIIKGITWNKCGAYVEITNKGVPFVSTYYYYPGINFRKCSNLSVHSCVFRHSVYLFEVSGIISFNHVWFLLNGPKNSSWTTNNNVAMGLTIIQPASIQVNNDLNISISNCSFSYNSLALYSAGVEQTYSSALLIYSNSISTNLNVFVSGSTFISNSIWLTPQLHGLSIYASIASIKVLHYLQAASVIISEVTFESNQVQLTYPSSILEVFIAPRSFTHMRILMESCNFINNAAFRVVNFQKQTRLDGILNRDDGFIQYNSDVLFNRTDVTIIDRCTFSQNVVGKSILYIYNNYEVYSSNDQFTVMNSHFENNCGTAIYAMNQPMTFKEMIEFHNSTAEYGTAVYLDFGSSVHFDDNSNVTFANNFARKYGGAIYNDVSRFSKTCDSIYTSLQVKNSSTVSFKSNTAAIAGNSIYFSISQSCNISFPHNMVTGFNFSETDGQLATSPNKLVFHAPAVLINSRSSVTYYKLSDVMLGQAIAIPACVLDFQENPAGSVLFQVTRRDFNQNYSLIAPNFIQISCEFLGVDYIHIIGKPLAAGDNSSVIIQFSSSYNSVMDWKPIIVYLIVELSPCHAGYFYDDESKQCICYKTDGIVSCSDGKVSANIMKGYWFGMVNDKPTVVTCPINYCKYGHCETATGMCSLPHSLDGQCSSHRTGPACGNCINGYTLSFGFVKCVNTNKCTTGEMILVVMITMVYWAVIVVVVFCIMYFQINIGYLYAITYFYSMLDIIFEQTLHPSEHAILYMLVAVLSGIVKLTPQFIGQLCFVQGLSGIDQQIIHFIHPLIIWLVLVIIIILARFSHRLSRFLSRGIIHAICLLILLSFTSGASSTSLLIMKGLKFTDIDAIHVYVSPDVEYFEGRHLYYSIVAYIFVTLIVIGLPLLLFSEPFLNNKINFIKLKPILDQFQACYKDRLRWFACYYMVCRQVILNIVVTGYDNFAPLKWLFITFLIINLIHWLVMPYASKILNIYDGLVLQTMTLIIALQIIYFNNFDSVITIVAAFILVMLPILMFLLMVLILNSQHIKKFYMSCQANSKPSKSEENYNEEAVVRGEYDVTVDQELREASTTIV